MRILGFCEGALEGSGGVGLVGVPHIHRSLAARGHRAALAVAGPPMPTARPMLSGSLEDVFASSAPAVGVVTFPAYRRWCFAPRLQGAASRAAPQADFITLHSLFSYPVLVGARLAWKHHTPYGLWPHGVLADVQRNVSRGRKAVYSAVVARRILDSASVLFFSGLRERQEAEPLGLNAPSVVIPHGIDDAPSDVREAADAFRARYLPGVRGPVLLYLGRLNAKKGLDLLMQALALVVAQRPETRLVVAGAGDPPAFLAKVHRWIAESQVGEHVVLTGRLDDSEKQGALAACDVFVMPSIAENFGFSMFEAMTYGKAVVCSDTLDYAPEVQEHGAGIAAAREPGAFADAILTLMNDETRRGQAGIRGRELAARYSWRRCGERLETAIRCVLERRPFPADLSRA